MKHPTPKNHLLRVVGIFTILLLVGCSKTLVPIERTAIFPKELAPKLLQLSYDPPKGITSFWTPSEKDLVGVENHLEEYLRTIWSQDTSEKITMPDWKPYYRQVGGIVINGKKMLFISYAYSPFMHDPLILSERKKQAEKQGRIYNPDSWKNHPIGVYDGGSRFFRVLYNPNKKQFVWYDQNGTA